MSSLKSKVEKSICGYLKSLQGFAGLNIEEGHSDARPDLPLMVVYAYDDSPHEDMPSETSIKNVRMRIYVEASANDTPRIKLDSWISLMDETMVSVEDIRNGCNKTEAVDKRKIKKIHIYDVTPDGSPDDMNEDRWIEEREFVVLASSEDAF